VVEDRTPADSSRGAPSAFLTFDKAEWGRLRAGTPLTLDETDLAQLRGRNESVSLAEVVEVYLPLSRLLNLYVAGAQELYRASATFLGRSDAKVPFILAITGSVAVGKSTTARVLRALLSRWENHPTVDLVTTDGFLWPSRELEKRDLMHRKGFPESYDVKRLVDFVARVKSGERKVVHPIYSHLSYDIVPGEFGVVDQPDILILEGLNVLQPPDPTKPPRRRRFARHHLAELFDFSIYVDAETEEIERWYIERFLSFRDTAFQDPKAFFHRYASLTHEQAIATATRLWKTINEVNLRENILATRERATLILEKAADHSVARIHLRKL
jgi:type I pantothenate kinase